MILYISQTMHSYLACNDKADNGPIIYAIIGLVGLNYCKTIIIINIIGSKFFSNPNPNPNSNYNHIH